eukprot:COSAG06_NODE_10992_length_1584_cov_5.206061_3_plen_125_part_00
MSRRAKKKKGGLDLGSFGGGRAAARSERAAAVERQAANLLHEARCAKHDEISLLFVLCVCLCPEPVLANNHRVKQASFPCVCPEPVLAIDRCPHLQRTLKQKMSLCWLLRRERRRQRSDRGAER